MADNNFDLKGFLNDPEVQKNKPAAIKYLQNKGIIDSQGQLIKKQPGFLQSLAKPFVQTAGSIGRAAGGVGTLAKAGFQRVRGDKEGASQTLREGVEKINKPISLGGGVTVPVLGKDEEGEDLSFGGQIKQGVGLGAEIGSYLVGGGGVAAVGKTAIKGATRGAIKQGVKQGAKYGAISGGLAGGGTALQEDRGVVGGTIGGAIGGGIFGGAIGGASATLGRAIARKGNLIVRRTPEEVLAVPESKVHKLPSAERKFWLQNTSKDAQKKAATIERKAAQQMTKRTEVLQNEATKLERELAKASRDEVLTLRPKILQSLGRQSQYYRKIVDEELAGKASLQVDDTVLGKFIDDRFQANPDLARVIKNKLGMPEIAGDIPMETYQKTGGKRTIQEILDQAKSMRAAMSQGSKSGSRVYSADEKLTDDAISTLTSFLKENGVDLSAANQFWAKYAPVRNQLIKESKPFLQSGTQTKTFANTLTRVAQGKDVNNEVFLEEVEKLVGQKVGTNIKKVLDKMSKNEKAQIALKAEQEAIKIENAIRKEQVARKLTEKELDIIRKSGWRKWIKGVMLAASGTGVATAVGSKIVNAGQ